MKILIIRRDNIGDLICTTPLIHALRSQLPEARIDALVTDYNAAVLQGNPDLQKVFSYRKAKHRGGESFLGVYWRRLQTILSLRANAYDLAVLPGGAHASSLRFARLVGAKRVVVRGDSTVQRHEVEHCCTLLADLGLRYAAPGLVMSAPALRRDARISPGVPVIGLHISARKPSQCWPADRFVELAHRLHASHGAALYLFWSPGRADNPLHPGDDEKARTIVDRCQDIPLFPVVTESLAELIAGIARCDRIVCSDGGAMHIAAGLGKPIVCFFGNSDPLRWRPWGVRHELLQKPSLEVSDIGVEEALTAFEALRAEMR